MYSRKLLLPLLVVAVMSACGRKEPPKPPPSKIPAPISDLELQQRGQEVLLTMSYPSVTLGGLPIEELEAIEIWQVSRILSSLAVPEEEAEAAGEGEAEPAEEPEAEVPAAEEVDEPETSLFSLPSVTETEEDEESKEDLIEVRGRDFAALAKLAWRIEGPEIDSAVVGNQLVVKVPLDEVTSAGIGEEEILVFGARLLAGRKRVSPFSNLVKLFPRVPPPPPEDLTIEATPDGVQIDWQISDEALGYRVYRRQARVRDYPEPIYKAREGLGSYLDRSAVFGERYIYTVTSVGNLDPLVESAVGAEHEVNYKDRFPPDSPSEVVALPETGRVRLLWQASASTDAQGYWIYRQDPGGSFEAINSELIVGSEYLDRDVASGLIYRYYLLAVDGKGNLSEASEEIEVRVP